MRIFYAAGTTPNPAFQSDLWRNNLYLPLVDLGHDVIEFQYDFGETLRNLDPGFPVQKEFIRRNRPRLSRELIRQVRQAHRARPVDLFFSYFYDACAEPEAIEEIKAMGIKTVNWYCNGSYQLHLVQEIAPHYDWCLVPEKFRLRDYVALGARPIYCQEAANPNIYKPWDLAQEFDVTFVGQAYGDRPAYLQYLINQGVDVRAWGSGWESFGGESGQVHRASPWRRAARFTRSLLGQGRTQASRDPGGNPPALTPTENQPTLSDPARLPRQMLGGVLSDVEMIQMYSRSRINLGFSSCGETHRTGDRILQIRLRDFEVPMSGGFYMIEYMEELEEFFHVGKEIVCYAGPEDLAGKIKFYLQHPTERDAIRQAGYERCRRDHTWHKRFETAFHEMGLP